nr:hypothetical protein [Tanacetum cinerariifolium]
ESAETGPPRVIVYGYDGILMQPVAPPSPDYVPRPEHPPSPDNVPGPEHPPSPVKIPYVPEPEYPEYLAPSDDEAGITNCVKASKPQSMQEEIEFATKMMEKKMLTLAERQSENKRKFEDTSRNKQNQQQSFKRNNVAQAYTAGPRDNRPYGGTKPLRSKCNYHHVGPCAQKCNNCKRTGYSVHDCKDRPAVANNNNNNNNHNNNNNQRAQWVKQRGITCFECGVQGHFRSDCPKLKNENQGNRAGNSNAVARAYAVGTAGTNPNSNVVMGTFLLNNRYALILFDTGADRSFISTAFSSLIDIIPITLDHGYDVELADGRII